MSKDRNLFGNWKGKKRNVGAWGCSLVDRGIYLACPKAWVQSPAPHKTCGVAGNPALGKEDQKFRVNNSYLMRKPV